jgi:GNAT superfamily N-acetyltransferase
MLNPEDVSIAPSQTSDGGSWFYMNTPKGWLKAKLAASMEYEIVDYMIYEAFRGQGYGKELLQFSVDHARSVGASAVFGSYINSRESLETIRSVMGEAVELVIESEGDFSPKGADTNSDSPTRASARLVL